jgi:hypothetical protein
MSVDAAVAAGGGGGEIDAALPAELREYLAAALPPHCAVSAAAARQYAGPFVASCLVEASADDAARTRTALAAGAALAADSREDGNHALQLKADAAALRHYGVALRVAEWAAGMLFAGDAAQTAAVPPPPPPVWLEIASIACACLSNGALVLLRGKEHARAQRWCERGLKQVAALLASLSRDGDRDAAGKLHGLQLKLQYRLGQALEGALAFFDATAAFDRCAELARALVAAHASADDVDSGAAAPAIDDAQLRATISDAVSRATECRQRHAAQQERARKSLAGMFSS